MYLLGYQYVETVMSGLKNIQDMQKNWDFHIQKLKTMSYFIIVKDEMDEERVIADAESYTSALEVLSLVTQGSPNLAGRILIKSRQEWSENQKQKLYEDLKQEEEENRTGDEDPIQN